jgi:hypothetical protein
MKLDPVRGVPGRVRPIEEANAVDRRRAAHIPARRKTNAP